MLLTSCDKEIETALTTSTQTLQFTADGGSQTFKIQSNNSWSIIPSASFATISPMTGFGDATVVVVLPEYEKMESRNCTLSILSDDGTKSCSVSIEQKGATATLDVDIQELIFEANAKCERTIKLLQTLHGASATFHLGSMHPLQVVIKMRLLPLQPLRTTTLQRRARLRLQSLRHRAKVAL